MTDPNLAWVPPEEAGWLGYLSALQLANLEFTNAEETIWNAYLNQLGILQMNLAGQEAGIMAQFNLDIGAALTAWATDEATAWGAYGINMASLPGPTPLGDRVLEPNPVQDPGVVAFAGLQAQPRQPQGVRVFGGALQLIGRQLEIPEQYAIERPNNRTIFQRVGQRLANLLGHLRIGGANGAGVLTGDIFDKSVFNYFNNLGPNENSVLVTINGINNTREDAEALLNSINSFNVGGRRVAVWNGTHGLGDFWQIAVNELKVETIADLRAAAQIEIAAHALRNNNGQGFKTIYVVAHSQGAEVFFRALNFLSPATKAMIVFYGLGGERFVPNDIGLADAINFYFSDDLVARFANATLLRRGYAMQHQYTVYRLPAAPGGSGHNWANNYQTLFNNANQISTPPGKRRINYGGLFNPFVDLILNRD